MIFFFIITNIHLLFTYTIRSSHPRVYLLPSDILRIRSLYTTSTLFTDIKSYVDRRINENTTTVSDTMLIAAAFVATINQELIYIDEARSYLSIINKIDENEGWDTGTRSRLYMMAIAYDWLYQYLNQTEKNETIEAMYRHIVRCDEFYEQLPNPNYVGGHSKLGNLVSLIACIALFNEDVRFDNLTDKIVNHWINGYNNVMDFTGKEGGHYMGWSYGNDYSRPEIFYLWYKATGEKWNWNFLYELPFFFMYASYKDKETNYYKLPTFGDVYSTDLFDRDVLHIVAESATLTRNSYAELFYQSILVGGWEGNQVFRMMLKDDSLNASKSFDLDLARGFPSAGFFVSRTNWDFNYDTLIYIFKSTKFASHNHHHYDQNSFTISFNGPLLCDSGHYDSYASNHWKNYYIKTIAHNSLLVYDPEETCTWANDGGQMIHLIPTTVEQIQSDEHRFDGIVSYTHDLECNYVKGDATRAYSSKVELFTREILQVYNISNKFSLFLVVDTIKLNKTLKPRILFHIPTEPIINGKIVNVVNKLGGEMRIQFITNGDLNTVNGTEKYTVDGTDYPPSREYVEDQNTWGRIEFSSKNEVNEETFGTVILVGNNSLSENDVSLGEEIVSEFYVGTIIFNSLIIIMKDNNTIDISINGDYKGVLERIFLVGCNNSCIIIEYDGISYHLETNEEGLGTFSNDTTCYRSSEDIQNSNDDDKDDNDFIIYFIIISLSSVIIIICVLIFLLILLGIVCRKKRNVINDKNISIELKQFTNK